MFSARRLAITATILLGIAALTGCTGGIHRAGDQQFSLHASSDWPIRGEAIWPDGDGRAENFGVTLGYNYFFQDRWAFLTNVTPYRRYNQSDGDITAGEFQIGFRWFFWEFDLADVPVGLYAEALGGILHASQSVPELGSNTNFTQDTGVGFEARISDHVSWQAGYRLRHLSNGHIFGPENPSQNDSQVYVGIAISW